MRGSRLDARVLLGRILYLAIRLVELLYIMCCYVAFANIQYDFICE